MLFLVRAVLFINYYASIPLPQSDSATSVLIIHFFNFNYSMQLVLMPYQYNI